MEVRRRVRVAHEPRVVETNWRALHGTRGGVGGAPGELKRSRFRGGTSGARGVVAVGLFELGAEWLLG